MIITQFQICQFVHTVRLIEPINLGVEIGILSVLFRAASREIEPDKKLLSVMPGVGESPVVDWLVDGKGTSESID